MHSFTLGAAKKKPCEFMWVHILPTSPAEEHPQGYQNHASWKKLGFTLCSWVYVFSDLRSKLSGNFVGILETFFPHLLQDGGGRLVKSWKRVVIYLSAFLRLLGRHPQASLRNNQCSLVCPEERPDIVVRFPLL